MHAANEFKNMYKGVSETVNNALSEISELNINNADSKDKLSGIHKNLLEIQSEFDKDLKFLEENSEWDKFTVAFFGETNAGKSTIIESLRILLNEKEREKIISKNNRDIEKIEKEFSGIFDKVINDSGRLFSQYNKEIINVKQVFSKAKAHIIKKSEEIKVLEVSVLKINNDINNGYREKIQAILHEENEKIKNKANGLLKLFAFTSTAVAFVSLSYLGYLGHLNFLLGL